eukprot:NODE_4483_length_317_cov_33.082090_g4401_i0.p1 GENE.NODE_4483_length_317_cov_33.082090_g4401_i0~~NODE_4483_length_317_cov_33.082090_g4401_i0.p1  ORF type:complete len:50 (-),score=8.35 NODE_4483_length_317_cov_33.082090_g4401_i0:72-221(-)
MQFVEKKERDTKVSQKGSHGKGDELTLHTTASYRGGHEPPAAWWYKVRQ